MKNLIRVLAIAATLCIVPGLRADDLSGAWKGSFDFNGASAPSNTWSPTRWRSASR